MDENYTIKTMSAHDQIKIEKLASSLLLEYLDCGAEMKDLLAVCHNAARIYCTTYLGEEKEFSSPLDVMKKLSLEEMTSLLCKNTSIDAEEGSINESFKEQ